MSKTILQDDLLGPSDAGEYIGGIKPQTLAVWRCSGRHDLPFIKVGNRVFYRRSALDAWLESRTMTHTGELATL